MNKFLKALWREEDGQDLVEYALIIGLISIVCVASLTAGGTAITAIWTNINAKLVAAS